MLFSRGVCQVTLPSGAGGGSKSCPCTLECLRHPFFWLQRKDTTLRVSGLHCTEVAEWFNVARFLRTSSSRDIFIWDSHSATRDAQTSRAPCKAGAPAWIPFLQARYSIHSPAELCVGRVFILPPAAPGSIHGRAEQTSWMSCICTLPPPPTPSPRQQTVFFRVLICGSGFTVVFPRCKQPQN